METVLGGGHRGWVVAIEEGAKVASKPEGGEGAIHMEIWGNPMPTKRNKEQMGLS